MSKKFKTGVETTTLKMTTGAGTAGAVPVADAAGVLTLTVLPAVIVYHGSTASTARPSTSQPVEWRGTVEPTNAINNDSWVDLT